MIGDPGPSIRFSGSGYLRMPIGGGDPAALDVRLGSYSLGCAINVTTAQAAGLYSKADVGALNGIMLELLNSTTVRGRIHGITASAGIGTLADGRWHWLALVLDRVEHVLRLYLDGLEIAAISTAAIAATDLNTSAPATWAAYSNSGAQFVGQLARMAVAPGVAWTAEQIAAQYRALVFATQNTAEARLIARPSVGIVAPQAFDGLPAYEALSAGLWNGDNALTPWIDGEVRGVPVRYHLYDVTTGAIRYDVFRGTIAAVARRGPVLSLSATALPLHRLTDRVPRARVITPTAVVPGEDPADVTPATTELQEYTSAQDYGAPLARGWGFCEGLHALNIAWGLDEDGVASPTYRYAVAAGNWAIGLVTIDGSASVDTAQWDADYRARIDGSPATVLTIGSEPDAGADVMVAARRLPDLTGTARAEWDDMLSWGDRLSGIPTGPGTLRTTSTITGAALQPDAITEGMGITDDAGPVVGAFLGCTAFDGATDYLQAAPVPAGFQAQDWYVTFFAFGDPAQSGTCITLPFWTPVASGDVPSARIRWNHSVGRYELVYRSGTNTEIVAASTGDPWHGWHAVTVAKEIGRVRWWIDRLLDTDITSSQVAIAYPTQATAAFLFGRSSSVTSPDWFKGRLGYRRFSLGVPTDREIEAAHATLWASPVEALREVLEIDLGLTIDDTAHTIALQTCADTGGAMYPNAVRLDGALQGTRIGAAEAIGQITRVLDMRLGIGADGITITVPTAPTAAVAHYEVGGGRNNVVGLPESAPASTADAVRRLIIAYDPPTNPLSGAVAAYRHGREFALAPIGRDNVTVDLPLVRSHRCADIVGERLWKLLKAQRDPITFAVGHEGRNRQLGDVVQFSYPVWGMARKELRLSAIGLQGGAVQFRAQAYDPSVYTYTGGRTLPTSPVVQHQTLQAGLSPSLEWDAATRSVVVRLESDVFDPLIRSVTESWETLAAATSHIEAVTDLGDNSYIQTASLQAFDCFATAGTLGAIPAGWAVAAVSVFVRARYFSPGSGTIRRVQGVVQLPGRPETTTTADLTSGFVEYELRFSRDPLGQPWSVADAFSAQVGVRAILDDPSEAVRVSRIRRAVSLAPGRERPAGFGFTKLWVRPTIGATTPVDGVDPAQIVEGLSLRMDGLTSATSYRAWATVYDIANRPVIALGPLTFTA